MLSIVIFFLFFFFSSVNWSVMYKEKNTNMQ